MRKVKIAPIFLPTCLRPPSCAWYDLGMTNNTSTQIAAQVASRYADLKFAPIDRAPRPTTRFRTARKAKRRTIR